MSSKLKKPLEVVRIVNSELELQSLPLRGSISIVLSEQPNIGAVDKYINVIDLGPREGVKQLPKTWSDVAKDRYERVALSFRYDNENDTIHISPSTIWKENRAYFLHIDKDLHGQTTTAQINGADTDKVEVTGINNASVPKKYQIELLSKPISSIKDGKKYISAKLSINDKVSIPKIAYNINDEVCIDGNVMLRFKDNAILAKGDLLTFVVDKQLSMLESYSVYFTTGSANKLVERVPTGTSGFISPDDIIKFNALNKLRNKDSTGGPPIDEKKELTYTVRTKYPNTIYIDFNTPINTALITPNSFSINTDYAFNNYTLENMGLYKDSKPILDISFHNHNKRVKIIVNSDDKNELHPQENYRINI